MLLKPEPHFLKKSLQMLYEVRQWVDDRLATFWLHRITTP
jgi:hypothetical protein